jgi:hypothetical protein
MTLEKLNREYAKASKRYFELEDKDLRTGNEQQELDSLEIIMADIANKLENY